jgi:GNAT superfamily N-acetyltransferase
VFGAAPDAQRRGLDGITTRAATPDDLPACERVWRDGLNDYLVRLGQLEVPEDNPGLRRLHEHTLATDPERFRVAMRGDSVVAFGSALGRGPVWFLSMLFVDPDEQAHGLGRRLLGELLAGVGVTPDGATPDPDAAPDAPRILATATDSVQPISNGLYASLGIVPQVPLMNLVGRPHDGWAPPPLPPGIVVTRLVPEGAPEPTAEVAAEVAALDREVLGFEHPGDHAFALRERPAAFAYRDSGGRLLGYGYTSEVGRIGPLAVRAPELVAPVLGHLLTAVQPRGASAVWLGGGAGPAIAMALEAGLRFEDFPLLLCWSRPFVDLARYVPISPGLL